MKITGPASGSPTEAPTEPGEAGQAGESAFADKLGPIGKTGAASGAPGAGDPDLRAIAADLQAGRITAAAAVERVVGHILDRPPVASAPAPVRSKVEAALREALTQDPLLAEKVRALATAK